MSCKAIKFMFFLLWPDLPFTFAFLHNLKSKVRVISYRNIDIELNLKSSSVKTRIYTMKNIKCKVYVVTALIFCTYKVLCHFSFSQKCTCMDKRID